MQINCVGGLQFRGITPIIADSKKDIKKIEDVVETQQAELDGAMVEDMTPVYKTWGDDTKMGKAAAKGKQVAFLITGEDYVKYCTGASGYKTQASLTRHVDREPVVIKG